MLLPRRISLLFCLLLLFLVLLLLQLLPFLLLLGVELLLLPLVLLVLLRAAGLRRSSASKRRQIVRMNGVGRTIGWRRSVSLPASFAATTPWPWNAAGVGVAAIGGLPWFIEARNCGLLRAASMCWV